MFSIFNSTPEKRFSVLIRPHLQRLYHQAYRLTNNQDDAEDLVQDLLLRLYEKKIDLKNIEKPANWLLRSLYHQFVDNYRKKSRLPIDDRETKSDELIESMEGSQEAPHLIYEQEMSGQKLQEAIQQLNPDQQALISLHDIEGYSLPELSGILELPLGTLKSRLHRARNTLREQFILQDHDLMEPFINNGRFTG